MTSRIKTSFGYINRPHRPHKGEDAARFEARIAAFDGAQRDGVFGSRATLEAVWEGTRQKIMALDPNNPNTNAVEVLVLMAQLKIDDLAWKQANQREIAAIKAVRGGRF